MKLFGRNHDPADYSEDIERLDKLSLQGFSCSENNNRVLDLPKPVKQVTWVHQPIRSPRVASKARFGTKNIEKFEKLSFKCHRIDFVCIQLIEQFITFPRAKEVFFIGRVCPKSIQPFFALIKATPHIKFYFDPQLLKDMKRINQK